MHPHDIGKLQRHDFEGCPQRPKLSSKPSRATRNSTACPRARFACALCAHAFACMEGNHVQSVSASVRLPISCLRCCTHKIATNERRIDSQTFAEKSIPTD